MPKFDLDALFTEHGDWETVATDLELALEEAEDDATRALALVAFGQVKLAHLDAATEAAELLEKALELDASLVSAWRHLADAYEAAEDWESVTGVLIDTVPVVSEEERGAVLRRAAQVYSTHLSQPEGAKLLLENALEASPFESETWTAYEAFLLDQGQHEALSDWAVSHAAVVSEAKGEVAAFPLVMAAARAYRAADNPDMAEVFISRAALLAPKDPQVLAAQVEIYAANEDWTALADVLDTQADQAADKDEELALRRRLTRLHIERLEDPEGAIPHLQRAVAIGDDPDDRTRLHTLYEATGNVAALVTGLRDRIAEASEEERISLQLELADLQWDGLDDRDAAAETLRGVISQNPGHAEACATLEELLTEAEAWAPLAAHLDAWAASMEPSRTKADVLMRRAVIMSSALGDAAGALSAAESARESDDTADGVLAMVVSLLEGAERHDETPPLYMRMAALASEAGDRDTWRAHIISSAAASARAKDLPAAISAYQAAVDADPADVEALDALRVLQAETGDVDGAIASLKAQAELNADESAKVSLLLDAAKLQVASSPSDAAGTLQTLLNVAPEHTEARILLADVWSTTATWEPLAKHLDDSVALERDLAMRAVLRARAGDVYSAHLNAPEKARERWEEALVDDPSCAAAARPLAELYLAEQLWERARPCLETIVAQHGDAAADVRAHDLAQLGKTLCRLGLNEQAVPHLEAALDLAPNDVDSALALAQLHVAAGRFIDADKLYRPLALEQLEAVPENGRANVFCNAGKTAAALGESTRAAELFTRALGLDDKHVATLQALATLDGDAVAAQRTEAQRTLATLADNPAERLKLQLELADNMVASGDVDGAVQTIESVLEKQPESKVALHKLLTICTQDSRWEEAADALTRLAKLEVLPARRDKFLFTIGAIYRDQLKDVQRAQNVFENLLDRDPLRTDAIEAIEALHRDRGAWKTLEKAYRRHLERIVDVPESDDMKFALATSLARLYREKLNRPDDAVAALELAARLRPDDVSTLVALAEVYPSTGKTDTDVIAQHRAIVAVAPEREASHQILFDAFRRQRRFDEAWTTAALLTVLGAQDASAEGFYNEHRPSAVALSRRNLGHADWRELQDPGAATPATRLLATIAATLRRVYSQDLKAWGVHKRKDRVDMTTPAPVTNLIHYCSQLMGVAVPEVYVYSGAGFANANTEPRALLVGADMLQGKPDRRKVFQVARAMCLLRNEYYLASALPGATLTALVQASISLFTGGPPTAWDSEPVRAWMDAIADESDEILAALGEAVQTYIQSGQSLDLRAWPAAVERTAGRAALLVCGDLQRAAQAYAQTPNPLGDVDARDRILALVAFAAKDDYSRLRAELGLGLGQQ